MNSSVHHVDVVRHSGQTLNWTTRTHSCVPYWLVVRPKLGPTQFEYQASPLLTLNAVSAHKTYRSEETASGLSMLTEDWRSFFNFVYASSTFCWLFSFADKWRRCRMLLSIFSIRYEYWKRLTELNYTYVSDNFDHCQPDVSAILNGVSVVIVTRSAGSLSSSRDRMIREKLGPSPSGRKQNFFPSKSPDVQHCASRPNWWLSTSGMEASNEGKCYMQPYRRYVDYLFSIKPWLKFSLSSEVEEQANRWLVS